MKEQLQKITADTLIPLGLVFILVGALRWVDHIAFVADANAQAVSALQQAQVTYNLTLQNIEMDLAVIKARLPERKHDSH